jgi:hypothetical protein
MLKKELALSGNSHSRLYWRSNDELMIIASMGHNTASNSQQSRYATTMQFSTRHHINCILPGEEMVQKGDREICVQLMTIAVYTKLSFDEGASRLFTHSAVPSSTTGAAECHLWYSTSCVRRVRWLRTRSLF